ncbi:MAG: alpha/beta fold hydrolase [Polyangiaceae bacterium]
MRRLRGVKHLVHDAVDLTLDLVEEGHSSTARTVKRVLDQVPGLSGPAAVAEEARRVSTSAVLGAIRGVHHAVQGLTEAGLDAVESTRDAAPTPESACPMRSDAMGSLPWVADAALGAINGAIGDHLHRRGNGLDLDMRLRVGDRYLTPDAPPAVTSSRVAIFVHGLGTTEWSWCLRAAEYHGDASVSFGTLLERDLGYTPVWVRYNTGRHVSESGRALADELARLFEQWPVPITDMVLIGHSMGGLVVRSACHYGRGAPWLERVSRVFCLGSPHQGAPLEKISNVVTAALGAVDLPGTIIPARLLRGRSAGIKDLRHGNLVDEDWLTVDPDSMAASERQVVPLVDHIAYYFVSATVTRDPEHPLGKIIGDLLVRVPSASGPDARAQAHRSFDVDVRCYGSVMHHELQNHPAVYAQIVAAMRGDNPEVGGSAPEEGDGVTADAAPPDRGG